MEGTCFVFKEQGDLRKDHGEVGVVHRVSSHDQGASSDKVEQGKYQSLLIILNRLKFQGHKVDELVEICDQMKSQITNSKKIQTKISDTLTQL